MKPNKPKATPQTVNSRVNQQIEAFKQRYGEAALDLACHGAFPLTLTTELLYCLREEYGLGGHWYTPADVLLSGLCRSVGYDLYEMDTPLRDALLKRLAQRFPNRLKELERYMVAYILHRLDTEGNERALVLGDPDPERMTWTAMACFQGEKLRAAVEKVLQTLVATDDNFRERLRLAALIESHDSLLAQQDFRPVSLLDLAEKVAEGEPINPIAETAAAIAAAGFPVLKTLEFEMAEVVLGEEAPALPIEQLGKFRFETVRLDHRGQVSQRQEKEASYFVEPLGEGGSFLEMVAIPGGRFLMGSPKDEPGRWGGQEEPQHEVTVQPFFLGRYAVTQAQWDAVVAMPQMETELRANPSRFPGDDLPVERVSWLEAVEFCERLSQQSGRKYRLPTEAEWEYACRANTTTPFAFGEKVTPEFVNYDGQYGDRTGTQGESRRKTTPVGSFPANPFGLYDMHGNVWEWCLDDWHGNYQNAPKDGSAWLDKDAKTTRKVNRGGSWDYFPRSCRSACRRNFNREDRNNNIGFRVMCEAPSTLLGQSRQV